jgi:hypothetical protein
MATGPSGWTRTTTTRVKSPACCVDTTEGMEPPRGIEPRPRPYQGRMLPLSPWRLGASGRIRTGRHRVGGPRSYRWTTLAWFGLRVSNPSLHAGDVECNLHTQAEHGPVSFTGPRQSSVVKDPALSSWWAARDSNPIAPCGRTGLRPVSGPSARTARAWRQRQDSNPDPRALEARMLPLHHAADVTSRFEDTPSLRFGPPFLRAWGKNKKGLPGDRPRRPLTA